MSKCIVAPVRARSNSSPELEDFRQRTRRSSVSGSVLQNDPVLPKVATGESGAVSECLERYGNLVWSLAKRSVVNEQAAEDAVQEIFMKIWKVAGKFNPEIASEPTFVAMIARRHLIDISRKKRLNDSGSEELGELKSNEPSASVMLELRDEAEKAAKILSTLPDDQRNVIKLSVYDGLSHSRIADQTGLSLGTVKTHLRRGMLKLRNALFPSSEGVLSTAAEGESL